MFRVKARSENGSDFGARVGLEIENGAVARVGLSDIQVGQQRWRDGSIGVVVRRQLPHWADDYQERLEALRRAVM